VAATEVQRAVIAIYQFTAVYKLRRHEPFLNVWSLVLHDQHLDILIRITYGEAPGTNLQVQLLVAAPFCAIKRRYQPRGDSHKWRQNVEASCDHQSPLVGILIYLEQVISCQFRTKVGSGKINAIMGVWLERID